MNPIKAGVGLEYGTKTPTLLSHTFGVHLTIVQAKVVYEDQIRISYFNLALVNLKLQNTTTHLNNKQAITNTMKKLTYKKWGGWEINSDKRSPRQKF